MSDVHTSNPLKPLGSSGLMVSSLGWGMWRFLGEDVGVARAKIDAAFDIGINLFDTADIYGFNGQSGFGDAETLLGKVFWEDASLREKMVLASKGGIVPGLPYDSRAESLVKACEASLKRMRTDMIDLWQVHRPDNLAHPSEVARAFDMLRQSGKVRAFGVSNYTVPQTRALQAYLDVPLASLQPEFSPLSIDVIQDGILDLAMETKCTVLAWSPLGGGRIAEPGSDVRAQNVVAALGKVAERYGVSVTTIAYAWVMTHPCGAIPLVGTQNPARIAEAGAAMKIKLERAEWYSIFVAARGAPMP
jgi:predicted oxidoreductase